MKKVLKGIINFTIWTSIIFLMIPFNIYAYDSPITGINFTVGGATVTGTRNRTTAAGTTTESQKIYAYNGQIVLDGNYIGVINFNLTYYYYEQALNGTVSTSTSTITRSVYVNGNTADFSFNIISWYSSAPLITQESSSVSPSLTINSSNLSVNNTGVQWLFPIESYSIVKSMLDAGFEIVDLYNDSYWTFPIFKQDSTKTIINYNMTSGNEYYLIFITSNAAGVYSVESLYRRFSFNGDLEEFKTLSVSKAGRLVRLHISNNTDSTVQLQFKFLDTNDHTFVPIYFGDVTWLNNSLDFSLNYGLRNELLNNLEIIANGSVQSQQSASDLENANDQMVDDMNDLATIESGYNQQFNNSLETIDFSNPMQSNAGMLPAANFVISIFNGLISNNPFSVLIIIVCILLIGKKVIGK